ncbi:MAG: hypothetical protein RIK85_17500, partial [Marinobacter sp.]
LSPLFYSFCIIVFGVVGWRASHSKTRNNYFPVGWVAPSLGLLGSVWCCPPRSPNIFSAYCQVPGSGLVSKFVTFTKA